MAEADCEHDGEESTDFFLPLSGFLIKTLLLLPGLVVFKRALFDIDLAFWAAYLAFI